MVIQHSYKLQLIQTNVTEDITIKINLRDFQLLINDVKQSGTHVLEKCGSNYSLYQRRNLRLEHRSKIPSLTAKTTSNLTWDALTYKSEALMNKLLRLQKALKLVFPTSLTQVTSLYNNKINAITLAPFTSMPLQSPCHFSLEVTSYLADRLPLTWEQHLSLTMFEPVDLNLQYLTPKASCDLTGMY